MTKGVTTKHILEKKDKYGEIELQEMCFYLENKFQVRMVIKVLRKLIMKQKIQVTDNSKNPTLAVISPKNSHTYFSEIRSEKKNQSSYESFLFTTHFQHLTKMNDIYQGKVGG